MIDEVQLGPIPDSSIQELTEEHPVPCAFRTGRAGTGKSFWVMEQTQTNPSFACVTATTGIAAVNLGAVTLNSVLKYFDTESMRDSFLAGHLTRMLHKIGKTKRWILVEEASMLEEPQLDYLYRAAQEANRYKDLQTRPLGIMLVGDFAQLPPVKGEWAFKASCWPEFASNTIRMDKVWRQDEGPFLDALNAARMGNGGLCAEILTAAGMRWNTARVVEFDGTTILCKNDMVSRHNAEVLRTLRGKVFMATSERWGVQRSEWGESRRTHEWGIPPKQEFKIGAYVMVLSNARDFSVVNGDCGYIRQWQNDIFTIELVRTGKTIELGKIVRDVTQEEEPPGWQGDAISEMAGEGWYPRVHFRPKDKKYVVGQITYSPLRLAYASTCHKAQGLTLDRVQVDLRDRFWQSPAMSYVALSRCRSLEGLRVVINKDSFINQVKMDVRVRDWL